MKRSALSSGAGSRFWLFGLMGASSLAIAALMPTPAEACSLVAYGPWVEDPNSTDSVPPPALGDVKVTVNRGQAAQPAGVGQCVATSCDDLGIIGLNFIPPTDVGTPTDLLGYSIAFVSGTPPEGMPLPAEPLLAPDGNLTLVWGDGATDLQEPFDFKLEITVLDSAGNRSLPTSVWISHPGSEPDPTNFCDPNSGPTPGCGSRGSSTSMQGMAGLAGLGLLGLLRMRARRR